MTYVVKDLVQIPIDIQLQLFDVLVKPGLLYGCEVWAHEGTEVLEKLHLRFCKYILSLNKSTCTNMVHEELGITPLLLHAQSRMIMFWSKQKLSSQQGKINCQMPCINYFLNYIMMVYMSHNGSKTVKHILESCGFSGVWRNQAITCSPENFKKKQIQQRLADQFFQKWSAEIYQSNKCINYRIFKTTLKLENYLIDLPFNQRRLMTMQK